ncbi:MAG TPA: ComF family protein [Cyanobacteria bacterium UBA11369]|nr:ComF family protein [Cyanobacteria bacterium UBA11369]
MGIRIPKINGLLSLFMQSECPICQRQTPQVLCAYCERQLQRCQLDRGRQLWHSELPVFAWGSYGGAVKRSLAVLKYNNKPQIAQPLGQWLGKAWLNSGLAGDTKLIVVPIPLHASKQRQRGYNQAELLAESFCQVTGLPLQRHGLERVRETEAQFTLKAAEREKNLQSAFAVGKRLQKSRSAASVLLLDDIYTTGATARAAADVLRRQGIRVYGLVAIAASGQNVSPR